MTTSYKKIIPYFQYTNFIYQKVKKVEKVRGEP